MRSAAACRKLIAGLGLHVGLEEDATSGFEFTVEDGAGNTVAYGWSAGNKTDALNEAVDHPAIKRRLERQTAHRELVRDPQAACREAGEVFRG